MGITAFELPQHSAIVILGSSSNRWGLGPLPFGLSVIGMPGCSLRVSNDFVTGLSGSKHQATLAFAIPNFLSLVGAVLHVQALVPDPAAGNPLGAVMSDAMTMTIGR
jgi:hypothetical protein